jgi:starch synthase (maltosyl-transferring)
MNHKNISQNIKGQHRVIIENVVPAVEKGKFPAKRVINDNFVINADVFADGHDVLRAEILYRHENEPDWQTVEMKHLVNDYWEGTFHIDKTGWYFYKIRGWIDKFKTWYRDTIKKYDADVATHLDFDLGINVIREMLDNHSPQEEDKPIIENALILFESGKATIDEKMAPILSGDVISTLLKYPLRNNATLSEPELPLLSERKKAAFSSWYEMFPRSLWNDDKESTGTFKSNIKRLNYVAELGFDVIYLPPIHPIGVTKRKGKNNAVTAKDGEPGSPWAIGAAEGGHKSIHPELGTMDDFLELVDEARKRNIEIALDVAFQCSPDHPWVKDHPEWFKKRPDGSIQYAENPPKKYEDIYPIDFETDQWQELWQELKSVFDFWIEKGIHIFRVDNPHTKSLRFWGWAINEIKKEHPDVIFLSEAFTRPKIMYQLAKRGFTQSYTYFTWRNTKWELTTYMEELTRTEAKDFFRPNLWPNTPDILPEYLQVTGRTGFTLRFLLAATLSSNYGIYGPAYELMDNEPKQLGKEEYLNSEKYELKRWDTRRKDSLKTFIKRMNTIRKENPALQRNSNLQFHGIENDQLIAYSKHTDDYANIILVIANLDNHHTHSGWVHFPTEQFGIPSNTSYQVIDLISNMRYLWQGDHNYVEINPGVFPAHIFKIRKKISTEHDFDYFM